MRLLLVDNYDSFTWNLAQYLEELGAAVRVVLHDAIDVEEARDGDHDAVVISPGPGRPEDAGISLDLVHAAGDRLPLLGVCLGHQALAQAHGAHIVRAAVLMHGKTSAVRHNGDRLYRGIADGFVATRYHSLVVEPGSVPDCLEVTARTDGDVIMGLRHREWPQWGVQFHPEAILTQDGKTLLANFLELARHHGARRSALS